MRRPDRQRRTPTTHALAAVLARALGLADDGNGHERERDRIEGARKALMQLGREPARLLLVASARWAPD